MMKNAFRCVQIVLLLFGVFGADEVKSVMEGDSVTLNPDLTQLKKINLIEWRFGNQVIAQIDENDISYPNPTEIFRDRLQLDQTGSLTIKNMKTKHSGLYKLRISHSAGNADEKFNVTVYASASDAGKSEMKSVSLKEGDRVTLQTDVTLSGDELIVWRFGDEGEVIAKADIEEAKSSPLYYDERFRGRLELDQTGSLIITNTRYTDSGDYTVKISSRAQTVYKRFTVTVRDPGLSPGAAAGIVVGVLLCVAAAAAVGVIYFRRKISELQKQTSTVSVTVKEGDPVTLKPNKEIKKDDFIQWMFGEGELRTSIAKFIGEIVTHDYAAGGIFSGRLKLDETTGSLTIRNGRIAHSGLYTLRITSSDVDSQQRFILTVNEKLEEISVEGGSVTLNPGTKIQRDDLMMWTFGDQDRLIAEIRGGAVEIYDTGACVRFRGRLELDKTTGSLTITDITPALTGLYKLQKITSSRGTLFKKFRVFMPWRRVHVITGKSVHLSTDRPEIQRDDEIQWRFGEENSLIAEIKGGTRRTYDGPDERFRDTLELNTHTGDLTILNSTDEHAGRYKLKICSSEGNTNKTYSVTITDSSGNESVNKSVSVETPLLDE